MLIKEGTSNFYIDNRCLVVTDKDFEDGNVPELKFEQDYALITEDEAKFKLWDVIYRTGYYHDGHIDYVRNCYEYWLKYLVDELGYDEYDNLFNDEEKFKEELFKNYDITESEYNKVKDTLDFSNYDESTLLAERLDEYLAEKEKSEVDKYLDKLKEEYGYEEIYQEGTLSDGTGIYRESLKSYEEFINEISL